MFDTQETTTGRFRGRRQQLDVQTRQGIAGQEPDSMFDSQETTTGRFRGRRQQRDVQQQAHDKQS
jgi:hypothetical protein